MRKIIISQFVILLGGVLFAWGNFVVEAQIWLSTREVCQQAGCGTLLPGQIFAPDSVLALLSTKCFMGALFFTAAFILSAMLLKKSNSSVEVK